MEMMQGLFAKQQITFLRRMKNDHKGSHELPFDLFIIFLQLQVPADGKEAWESADANTRTDNDKGNLEKVAYIITKDIETDKKVLGQSAKPI